MQHMETCILLCFSSPSLSHFMIGKIWRRNCHHVTIHMQIQWKFSSGCIHTMNKLMRIQSCSLPHTMQYSYPISYLNFHRNSFWLLVATDKTLLSSTFVSIRSNTIACLSIFHVNFEIFVRLYQLIVFVQFSGNFNTYANKIILSKRNSWQTPRQNSCYVLYGSQISKYNFLGRNKLNSTCTTPLCF